MRTRFEIQGADLTLRQEGDVAAASDALSLFRDFDWDSECSLLAEREAAGEDTCPPNLGLISDCGDYLRLCPTTCGNVDVFGRVGGPRRGWLRLRQTHKIDRGGASLPMAHLAITKFINSDFDWFAVSFSETSP